MSSDAGISADGTSENAATPAGKAKTPEPIAALTKLKVAVESPCFPSSDDDDELSAVSEGELKMDVVVLVVGTK